MVDANLLLDLVTVARRPVPLRVCAAALDASEDDVIEAASNLVSQGTLLESADGYAVAEESPEPSPVRSGRAARVLAKGLIATDADPAWIGSALARSDTPSEAIPYLVKAADALAAEGRVTEAMSPAGKVLEFGSGVDRETEGRMHLIRGRGRRFTGDSDGASEDFEDAAARLEGEPRIDALGFAASGASDLQQPQRAERLLATAAAESIADFPAKLGSLCALWAREVSRLGFPDEAEALLDKSDALLDEHGSSFQRYLAKWNRAWIYVDRGDYRRAEADLDALVHTAGDEDHAASDIAEKRAYHGRALFGVGRPAAAIGRLDEASADATPSIRYLVALAESEGYPRYGAWSKALEATDRLNASVEELVPAWRNVGLFLRAKALAGSGQLEEARRTVAEAILACPPGVNGWRWRQRCRALQMDLAAHAGQPFPAEEAEGLVEEMLRAQWLGPAAELLVAVARHTKAPDRARQAMALAWKGGDVMLAAEAAHVAGAWDSELASPIVDRVRRIEGELDEGMAASLRELPHGAAALAVERDVSEDETALRAEFEEALTAVLGDDPTLTPAQRRRAKTLARRRRRATLVRALGGVAILAFGGLAVWAAVQGNGDGVTERVIERPGETIVINLSEEPILELPETDFVGQLNYRGGNARLGVFPQASVPEPNGYYWLYDAGATVRSSPVIFGRLAYVTSLDGSLHAINMTTGESPWQRDSGAPISSTPAIGAAQVGEGTSRTLVFFGNDDGAVFGVDALTGAITWEEFVGGRVTSAPVLTDFGTLLAATQDGRMHVLDAITGDELWRYPAEDQPAMAPVRADIAYQDGFAYLMDSDGSIHVVNVETQESCTEQIGDGGRVGPVLTDQAAVFYTRGLLQAVPLGRCTGLPSAGFQQAFGIDQSETAPAIVGSQLIFANSQTLLSADTSGAPDAWTEILSARLTSPPIVVGDIVLIGDVSGTLHARSLADGTELWTWDTGDTSLSSEPAVTDGLIVVVDGNGLVYGLGRGTLVDNTIAGNESG